MLSDHAVANTWWEPSSLPNWLTEQCYVQRIQPLLRGKKIREIAQAMQVSRSPNLMPRSSGRADDAPIRGIDRRWRKSWVYRPLHRAVFTSRQTAYCRKFMWRRRSWKRASERTRFVHISALNPQRLHECSRWARSSHSIVQLLSPRPSHNHATL